MKTESKQRRTDGGEYVLTSGVSGQRMDTSAGRSGKAKSRAQVDLGKAQQRGPSPTHFQAQIATPFGMVGIRTEGKRLAEIVYMPPSTRPMAPQDMLAEKVCRQIERYLADPEYRFALPLKEIGSPFQRRVWALISSIPCGQTRTYGALARMLRSAPRAVGGACGTNYYPLVIPCHRVVAANGIGGFAQSRGGYLLDIKRWLLQHEHAA